MGVDLRTGLDALFAGEPGADLSDGQLVQRFVAGGDEPAARAAFAALLARHGPMVLRVCGQTLEQTHDAQDAFQATWLVLARKAGSVRDADSVASWLHGVALRVAGRIRAETHRRRTVERRAAVARTDRAADRPEAYPELHQAIARLPGRYREPLVLHYLEGLSVEEVAWRLDCPRGTILSRLARGARPAPGPPDPSGAEPGPRVVDRTPTHAASAGGGSRRLARDDRALDNLGDRFPPGRRFDEGSAASDVLDQIEAGRRLFARNDGAADDRRPRRVDLAGTRPAGGRPPGAGG